MEWMPPVSCKSRAKKTTDAHKVDAHLILPTTQLHQPMSSYLSAGAFKLRQAREWVTPTRKESAFLDKGVLTPEEFVKAGDELCFKCPTWQWERGDANKVKAYLPADKQYLVTRNVPCMSRASGMEQQLDNSLSTGVEDDQGESDWCISHTPLTQHEMDSDDFHVLDIPGDSTNTSVPISSKDTHNRNRIDEDEYADLDEFEDNNVLVDEAVATGVSQTKALHGAGDGNIVKVRTYGTLHA
jgi:ubiquitin-like-conjugating enzyme ATG3